MRHGRCADAAFGADDRDDAADRLGIRRSKQPADRAHDVDRADRRHQIFAHAAPRQLAVEPDVIDAAENEHARAGVADFGQLIEPVQDVVGAGIGFDQDDIRRRRAAIGFRRSGNAAHLDLHMRFPQPAVFSGGLHGGGGLDRLAEGLDRHAWRGRDMCIGRAFGRRARHPRVFGDGDLLSLLHHFPRSLILPVS